MHWPIKGTGVLSTQLRLKQAGDELRIDSCAFCVIISISISRRAAMKLAARATVVSCLVIVAACSDPDAPPPITTVPGLGGTLVVPNKMASTVTIVDVASGERLATIPVGPEPHEIALSA